MNIFLGIVIVLLLIGMYESDADAYSLPLSTAILAMVAYNLIVAVL